MMHFQTQQYYDRMATSIGDKGKMLQYAVGTVSVDMGTGDGKLVEAMLERGFDAYGVDAAHESYEQAQKSDALHGRISERYVDDLDDVFADGSIDTITASSILHEVYSYGDTDRPTLDQHSLERTLAAWARMLRPGGRLIIRDGVIPDDWADLGRITFKDGAQYQDGIDMVAKYLADAPFATDVHPAPRRRVGLTKDGDGYIGTRESIMEFLYTYNWGLGSYPRETQELYGLYTLDEYTDFVETFGFTKVHAHAYVQEGYVTHLGPKVQLTDADGNATELPPTNCIMVFEKK